VRMPMTPFLVLMFAMMQSPFRGDDEPTIIHEAGRIRKSRS
jgi:hypothetical protein